MAIKTQFVLISSFHDRDEDDTIPEFEFDMIFRLPTDDKDYISLFTTRGLEEFHDWDGSHIRFKQADILALADEIRKRVDNNATKS